MPTVAELEVFFLFDYLWVVCNFFLFHRCVLIDKNTCFSVRREHLCSDVTSSSWMLEPFYEVGSDVPEYFLSG